MPVTDADQAVVVALLIHDLHATVGAAHDHLVVNNSGRLRLYIEDVAHYFQKVVDDTQQDVHDGYIDTVWPKCPRHAHPLWFHDGAWWCEQDNVPVALLGKLRPHTDSQVS